MREITKIIEELNEIQPKWEKQIIDIEELEDIYNSDLAEIFGDLIGILRGYVKEDDESKIEYVRQLLKNKKTMDVLLQCVDKTMMHYKNFAILRGIEKRDIQIVKQFIKDSIENYVVRVDYQFCMTCDRYMIEQVEEMKAILGSMDCLTEYYVRRLFVKSAISMDFKEETGLSEEVCQLYAEMIDKYFQDIKMNIILQDTEYIRRSI